MLRALPSMCAAAPAPVPSETTRSGSFGQSCTAEAQAITDESGHLTKFDRMDGGKISSISIAIDKAFTGAVARRGTHIYNELCVPGNRPSAFTKSSAASALAPARRSKTRSAPKPESTISMQRLG
jgi:hypothetical protein